MKTPIIDPHPELEAANDEYVEARQQVIDYVLSTSRRRAEVAAKGTIRQVITVLSAEMAVAGSLGQLDTVRQLGAMAEAIIHAEANLLVGEGKDYARRFGDDLPDADHTVFRQS
jgi:hypothetical protein